ncbi:hypothetical protein [Streptomyces sp. BA2]|uniref:hypothetical protein n=1 Tax=Streptomyces sp. BA2 TaxID=436595 RepID=UPI001321392A|nr:hypothetical protein [Streptomyces sp. BA2]MWA10330.1 hypothetical protein [Streptomyces sp. BA2]
MRLGKALATGMAEEDPQERLRRQDLEQRAEPEPEPAVTAGEPAAEVPAAR